MDQQAPIVVGISIGRVLLGVVRAIVFLVLANLALRLSLYYFDDPTRLRTLQTFNLAAEQSLGAWFTSILHALAAALLFVIATDSRRRGDGLAGRWSFLGFVFLFLSVDEAASLHETLNPYARRIVGSRGVLRYPWLVFGAAFAIGFGVAYLPFLRRIASRTALRFLVAGALFVLGAVGFEMLDGYYASRGLIGTPKHILATTVEETLEMVGVTLFLRALLLETAARSGTVVIDVEAPTAKTRVKEAAFSPRLHSNR